MMKKSSALYELTREGGHIKGYKLMGPCRICKTSGKKSCSLCNNTGKCYKCKGSGRQRVERTTLRNGRFVTYNAYESCKRLCSSCNGRTLKCLHCNGTGRKIDTQAVKKASNEELNIIYGQLDEMLAKLEE